MPAAAKKKHITTEAPAPLAVLLALDEIEPDPEQPRQTFDIDELAEDLKLRGVIQHLLVRPKGSNGLHRIIDGERRWRAAKKARLAQVPCVIRSVSEAEALEQQLALGDGGGKLRQALSPLEEAAGLRKLEETHKYSKDDIAARIGKSREYVYAKLKLLELGASGRKALLAGELPESIATALARIPDAKAQEKATGEVLEGGGYDYELSANRPMPVRKALKHIREHYMCTLRGAPFNIKDPDLLPEAGACTTCPFRTGAQPDLFRDVKGADVCTNPPCFQKKKAAAWKEKQAALEAKGVEVLSDKESKKLFDRYGFRFGSDTKKPVKEGSGYIELSAKTERHNPKAPTWEEKLKKVKDELPVVIARDPETGKARELVRLEDVQKVAKDAGVKVELPKPRAEPNYQEQYRKEQERAERRKRVALLVIRQVVAGVEKHADVAHVLRWLVGMMDTGQMQTLAQRRGWAKKGETEKRLSQAGPLELVGVMAELLLSRGIERQWGRYDYLITEACSVWGIDLKALEKADAARAKAGGQDAPAHAEPEAGEAESEDLVGDETGPACSHCGCTEDGACMPDGKGVTCTWVHAEGEAPLCSRCAGVRAVDASASGTSSTDSAEWLVNAGNHDAPAHAFPRSGMPYALCGSHKPPRTETPTIEQHYCGTCAEACAAEIAQASKPAKTPKTPKKKSRITDVQEGETEEQALAREAAPTEEPAGELEIGVDEPPVEGGTGTCRAVGERTKKQCVNGARWKVKNKGNGQLYDVCLTHGNAAYKQRRLLVAG